VILPLPTLIVQYIVSVIKVFLLNSRRPSRVILRVINTTEMSGGSFDEAAWDVDEDDAANDVDDDDAAGDVDEDDAASDVDEDDAASDDEDDAAPDDDEKSRVLTVGLGCWSACLSAWSCDLTSWSMSRSSVETSGPVEVDVGVLVG